MSHINTVLETKNMYQLKKVSAWTETISTKQFQLIAPFNIVLEPKNMYQIRK